VSGIGQDVGETRVEPSLRLDKADCPVTGIQFKCSTDPRRYILFVGFVLRRSDQMIESHAVIRFTGGQEVTIYDDYMVGGSGELDILRTINGEKTIIITYAPHVWESVHTHYEE
jgi:hypothetical protein